MMTPEELKNNQDRLSTTMDNLSTRYLGDGVYASYDGYQICLKANDAENPSDTVYLIPEVMTELIRFCDICSGT